MNKQLILIFAIFSFCIQTEFVAQSNNFPNDSEIQKRLEDLSEENGVPGINLSIIFDDGEQRNYSAGYADKLKKDRLDSEHVMFSGSIGKTYAVALLMQLADEGKIDLTKKYIDYFPEIKWLKRLANINDITSEMLLKHTSGLPGYIANPALWDSLQHNPDKVWTYEDRFSMIYDWEPVHVAGKGWAYSDTNYLLLGMLIEKVTRTYYYDELRERFLNRYNLVYTFPGNKRNIQNLPIGYSKLDPFFKMPEITVKDGKYCFNPQMEWTGGGFASTTSDLAKWAKLYYTENFFSDSLKTMIITPNVNAERLTEKLSYGAGSFIYHTVNGDAYGHTGFVPGFNSIIAYFPEHNLTFAMQINCDYSKKNMDLIGYITEIMNILND